MSVLSEQLVEMGGSVSWNRLTVLWHASAYGGVRTDGSCSYFNGSGKTPEEAVANAHAAWVKGGCPEPRPATPEERDECTRWCDEREQDRKKGEALRIGKQVSDIEAELFADQACGSVVDSAVTRAFVGGGR